MALQQIDRIPWDLTPTRIRKFAPGVWKPDDDPVELYYLPDDFTQGDDLAARQPRESQAELRQLFWAEAERYKVLPLLGGLRCCSACPAAARRADPHLPR